MFKLNHSGFRKGLKKMKQGSDSILPQLGKLSCQLTHLCDCSVRLQLRLAASGSLETSGSVFGGTQGSRLEQNQISQY